MRNALRRAKDLDAHALILEIQLARARLAELIGLEPANHDILLRLMSTITRMVAVNHSLSPQDERTLGGALQELLAELMPDREIG